MIGCLSTMENKKEGKQKRINALLRAYSLLLDIDRQKESADPTDLKKAVYYWRVVVKPEARQYKLKLEHEPEFADRQY